MKFFVERTLHLPSSNVFIVEGRLLDGKLNAGDIVHVAKQPDRCVKVKSIALVNKINPSETLTLSVEQPNFPLTELSGSELV